MKPQKRFHSGKANLSLLRKNTQTKRGARPINRLNERESGNPAAPPPLLPTEGPFPPPPRNAVRGLQKRPSVHKNVRAQIKKPPPKRETAFSRPQQTFLKQCALPQSKKSSHRRNHVTLSRNALRKSHRERALLPKMPFSPAFLNHTVERSSPVAGKESDSRGGRWEVQLRAGGR